MKEKRKPSGYDTAAIVKRIEGSTAWVAIEGGIDETPVKMSIDAKPGDNVNVRLSGGRAWITGNNTAPPTDDRVAREAADMAEKAGDAAKEIVGKLSEGHLEIEPTGIRIYANNGRDLVAILEYGPGYDESGNIADATYITLGGRNDIPGNYSFAAGESPSATGYCSHAAGRYTIASGNYSHAEGYDAIASGDFSHAEGYGNGAGDYTIASGDWSHAEGRVARATGDYSHAEGEYTTASGVHSHAEGSGTTASGDYSHAEGRDTIASGNYSFTEGYYNRAYGAYSHAEGSYNQVGLYAVNAHVEGVESQANADASHAQNEGTIADTAAQTAIGKYNEVNTPDYAFVVGNGTDHNARSDAFAVEWTGDIRIARDLYVGCSEGGVADVSGGTKIQDLIYPVGSIYMSVNSTSPATLFGGTWERIKDVFLLAAGGTYAAGGTGGDAEVTLTAAQSGLPAHKHEFTQPTVSTTLKMLQDTASGTAKLRTASQNTASPADTRTYTATVTGGAVGAVTGGAAGAASPHNNMPPYLAVYVWKRTA